MSVTEREKGRREEGEKLLRQGVNGVIKMYGDKHLRTGLGVVATFLVHDSIKVMECDHSSNACSAPALPYVVKPEKQRETFERHCNWCVTIYQKTIIKLEQV